MKKMLITCTTALTALAVSGCATTVGKEFNAANVDKLKIGQTTTQQTLTALGEPFSRSIVASGSEQWVYMMNKSKGRPKAKAFIPYFGMFLKNSVTVDINNQQLVLGFADSLLTSCTLTFTQRKGTGGGVLGGTTSSGTTKKVACGK